MRLAPCYSISDGHDLVAIAQPQKVLDDSSSCSVGSDQVDVRNRAEEESPPAWSAQDR